MFTPSVFTGLGYKTATEFINFLIVIKLLSIQRRQMSISHSPSPSSIPQALLTPTLSKYLRSSNYFRQLRKHKHPLFPHSDQVVSPEKKVLLRIYEQFTDASQLVSKARQLETLAELGKYPVFLTLEGFTARQIDNGYEVNTLLEYGGSSLDTEVKKRQGQENPIVTEEELWDILYQVAYGLVVLEQKGLVRHAHLMLYSLRKINGQFKLLYNLEMPKCFDLAQNKVQEYYRFYLSPEELSILRNQSPDRHLSSKSDIFSLGMMVLNLATLRNIHSLCYSKVPATKASLQQNNIHQKLAYVGQYYSKQFIQVLEEMLKQGQEERIPAIDLVEKIERHLKVQNQKKQIYLGKLIKAHEISKLPGVKYELPADESKVKQIIKKKEAEKLKQKHQHHTIAKKGMNQDRNKQIIYRGTFGKPSQQDEAFTVHLKTHIHMKPMQDIDQNQFEQPEAPKMYSPSVKSGKSNEQSMPSKSYKDIQQGKQQVKSAKSFETSQTKKIYQFIEGNSKSHNILSQFMKQSADIVKTMQASPKVKEPQKLKVETNLLDIPTVINEQSPQKSPQTEKKQVDSTALSKQMKISSPQLAQSPIKVYKVEEQSHSIQQISLSQSRAQKNSLLINKPQASSPPRTLKRNKSPVLLEDLLKKFTIPGVFIKGNIYYGPILNGRRNGMGLQIFPNNEYYYGNFQNDLFHGQGVYFWSPEEYFDGIFDQGSKVSGWMVVRNRIYSGQFKNNKRHGKGTAYYDGESYQGEWKEGKKDGQGVLWYGDAEVFKGRWVKGRRSGPGSLQTKGFTIIGDWYNDQLNGFAEIRYKNGDIYKGEYRDSQKTGKGHYLFAKGTRFQGYFDNDQMAKGLMIYVDGSFYDGDMGGLAKRHGTGTYVYPNGDKYSGLWADNKKHGWGKYETYEQTFEGPWVEGLRHGKGIMIHNTTGKKFSVQYDKDVLKSKDIIDSS